MSKAPLFVLLVVLLVGQATAVNDVLVKNLKIYVNCEEFFIKAFCYSPTPLGRSMDPNVSLYSLKNINIVREKEVSALGELMRLVPILVPVLMKTFLMVALDRTQLCLMMDGSILAVVLT